MWALRAASVSSDVRALDVCTVRKRGKRRGHAARDGTAVAVNRPGAAALSRLPGDLCGYGTAFAGFCFLAQRRKPQSVVCTVYGTCVVGAVAVIVPPGVT